MNNHNGNNGINAATAAANNMQYHEAIQRCVNAGRVACEGGETHGWISKEPVKNVEMWHRLLVVDGSNINFIKGIVRINAPAEIVREIFIDTENRSKWDDMFEHGHIIEEVDMNTSVYYLKFKFPFPTKSRDLCIVTHCLDDNDGSLWIFSTSVTHPDCPQVKDAVRANLILGVTHLVNVPGDEESCDVTHAVAFHPRGKIPIAIVNLFAAKKPLHVATIRDLMNTEPTVVTRARRLAGLRKRGVLKQFGLPSSLNMNGGASPSSSVTPSEYVSRKNSRMVMVNNNNNNNNNNDDDEEEEDDITPSETPLSSSFEIDTTVTNNMTNNNNDDDDDDDDWKPKRSNERMPPNRYDDLLTLAHKRALEAIDLSDKSWTFNSRQKDVDIYLKQEAGSDIRFSRGVGDIDVPWRVVLEIFVNEKVRKRWDELYAHGHIVEEVDPLTVVSYTALTSVWPVTPRDMVLVSRSTVTDEGGILIYSISCDHEREPPKSKCVRCILLCAAIYIRPLSKHSCRIIYCSGADPKGSIPKFIANAASIKSPLAIAVVRSLLENDPSLIAWAKDEIDKKEAEKQERLENNDDNNNKNNDDGKHMNDGDDKHKLSYLELLRLFEPPPCEYDDILQDAYTACWEAVNTNENDGWVFNQTKRGVDIFIRAIPGSPLNQCKGIGEIGASVELIREIWTSYEWKPLWDEMFDKGRVLQQLDAISRVSYTALKTQWPATPRDLCIIGRTEILKDGSCFIYSASIEHPDAPRTSKYVRSEVVFGAVYIQPLSTNMSRVIYAVGADPKGSLPTFIVNMVNTKQPLNIAKISDLLHDHPQVIEQAKAIIAQKRKNLFGHVAAGRGKWKDDNVCNDEDDDGDDDEKKEAIIIINANNDVKECTLSQLILKYKPPSSTYDHILEKAYDSCWEAVNTSEKHGWKFVKRSYDVDIYVRSLAGNPLNQCKGVGEISFNIDIIREMWLSLEWASLWDEMLDYGKILETVDATTTVTLKVIKTPWPVTSREACFVGRTCVLNDGSIFIYSASVEHKDAPITKKYVRTDLVFGTLLLTPLSSNRTRVVYAVGADPKGNLPTFVVNMLNTKQPLCISKLRRLMTERPDIVKECRERLVRDRKQAIIDDVSVKKHGSWKTVDELKQVRENNDDDSTWTNALRDHVIEFTPEKPLPELKDDTHRTLLHKARENVIAALRTRTQQMKHCGIHNNITIYTPLKTPIAWCKGVSIIEEEIELVLHVLSSSVLRAKWDKCIYNIKNHTQIDENTSTSTHRFRCGWFVSARTIEVIGRHERLDDGSHLIYSTSLPSSGNDNNNVHIYYSGVHIHSIPGASHQTHITTVISMDLKGWLLQFQKRSYLLQQPLFINALRRFINESPLELMNVRQVLIRQGLLNDDWNDPTLPCGDNFKIIPWSVVNTGSINALKFSMISTWSHIIACSVKLFSSSPLQFGMVAVRLVRISGLEHLVPYDQQSIGELCWELQVGTNTIQYDCIKYSDDLCVNIPLLWRTTLCLPAYNPYGTIHFKLMIKIRSQMHTLSVTNIDIVNIGDGRGYICCRPLYRINTEDAMGTIQLQVLLIRSRVRDFMTEFIPSQCFMERKRQFRLQPKPYSLIHQHAPPYKVERRTYHPELVGSLICGIDDELRPWMTCIHMLRSLIMWNKPWLNSLLLLLLLMSFVFRLPVFPLLVSACIGLMILSHAQVRYRAYLADTVTAEAERTIAAARRQKLIGELRKHSKRHRKSQIMLRTQQQLTACLNTIYEVNRWFFWVKSEWILEFFMALVVLLCLSLVLPFNRVLLLLGLVCFSWFTPPFKALRRIFGSFRHYLIRQKWPQLLHGV